MSSLAVVLSQRPEQLTGHSAQGPCELLNPSAVEQLADLAGPSGIPPTPAAIPDYVLPLHDNHAADLLASVLTGQPTLGTACSRLNDKRSTYAATAFLSYSITNWPTDDALTAQLLREVTVHPPHLLSCILCQMCSTDSVLGGRTAAEALKAWTGLCMRVPLAKLLELVIAEPGCLPWLLLTLEDSNQPMPLHICGTVIPFGEDHCTAAGSSETPEPTHTTIILGMVSTASEAMLETLVDRLLTILKQQYGRCTAAAAMFLHAVVERRPSAMHLLLPHLSTLLDAQRWLCGRDQDYILQVISAVAASEHGTELLAQCDLAPLVEAMQQQLTPDSIAPGLAADIIASRLAQSAAGRAALLPHTEALAEVCEQKVDTFSAAVPACAVHTLKWIADCCGTAGQKAVRPYVGAVLTALARMSVPEKALFWEVGESKSPDSTDQRSIVDLAVEDAAALVREACSSPVGAAYIAARLKLAANLHRSLKYLCQLGAERPVADLCVVLATIASIPAGEKLLACSGSLDVMLQVASSGNSRAAQQALEALCKVLHVAASGAAEIAGGASPAAASSKHRRAVANKLSHALRLEHVERLLLLLHSSKLVHLVLCCLYQLLEMKSVRFMLAPYSEALQKLAYTVLLLIDSKADFDCMSMHGFDEEDFLLSIWDLACQISSDTAACMSQLQDANQVMNQAVIDFAEAHVACHHVGNSPATQRTRQDGSLVLEKQLLVVCERVHDRDAVAERLYALLPKDLPGPSLRRVGEMSLDEWL